jgi:hypothetical protein
MRHRQKAYGSKIQEIQQSGWPKFMSVLQGPWNSIEHQVRKRIILTFTSFSIMHLHGITCFLSSRTVFWYTSKASTESLWTVDSKIIVFRPWKITFSAAEALKFNRTQGSKSHNINFHVFFDYAPGITCFVSSWTVFCYTSKASTESLLTVDSKNTIFRQA